MPIKPGYQTTEFYITLATLLTQVLVIAGIIGPQEATDTEAALKTGISGLVILITTVAYIIGRVQVKAAAAEAVARTNNAS